jgi:hypothetical protein
MSWHLRRCLDMMVIETHPPAVPPGKKERLEIGASPVIRGVED